MPHPTLHPAERIRKLAAFNNYFNLYRGVCAGTGESIIQMFRPGKTASAVSACATNSTAF